MRVRSEKSRILVHFAALGQEGQTLPPQAPTGSGGRLPLSTSASYSTRIPSHAELVRYRKQKGPRLQQLQQKQGVGRYAVASFLQLKANLRSRWLYIERASLQTDKNTFI